MAKIIVKKSHLIAMGLYSKFLNNEQVVFSEEEVQNFANAYIKDKRRPVTDLMRNEYAYDFNSPAVYTSKDIIAFNPNNKTYFLKSGKVSDVIDAYMNDLSIQAINYLEMLGKDRKYASKENQPEA